MTCTKRLVVVTAESASASPAVREILRRYQQHIALVVISHPDQAGSLIAETRTQWRRSGPALVWFLLVNFTLHRAWCWIHDLVAAEPLGLERLCTSLGLATHITTDINDDNTKKALVTAEPDVVIVCYFEQILHEPVLAIPAIGTLNIHTALLPTHRGLFPEIWAIDAGDNSIGVTVHEITDRSIDAGPIKAQQEIVVDPALTVLALSQVAHRCGVDLLESALERLSISEHLTGIGPHASYHSFPTRDITKRLGFRRLARLRDLKGQ